MRRRALGFAVQGAGLRFLLGLLRLLGPVAASDLAGFVARTVGPLLPVCRVADRNLRLALPELDARARRVTVRQVWDNLGRTVGELPHFGQLGATAEGPGWELLIEPEVLALLRRPEPLIMVAGHLGNWEIPICVGARLGLPTATVYRAAANPAADAILKRLRREAAKLDAPSFPKGAAGSRGIIAHLKAGGRLAMLVDQKMNDGIEARLFGHPAMTSSAAASLALHFGCPILPVRTVRLGPARFRVVVEAPLALPSSGDRHSQIAALTQAINDRLELWIRDYPGQWLWLHRRWPRDLWDA